jgi:UV radiation resistance-associated gene protein
MNIYQTNFIKNSSISLKQKRLRHISLINGKNLKINSNRFNIWFTLHLNKTCKAFYISDKKENDRNPKWTLLNMSKMPHKEFLIRVWYTNLDEISMKKHRLCLLIEWSVNLDLYVQLNDETLNHIMKTSENFFIFEIFGLKFCEALNENHLKKSFSLAPNQITNSKNSYTLNLMNRLHDFQRVMHEASLKIGQIKQNSMAKFDPASRVRQLQVKRELKLQRIKFLKENLDQLNASNTNLDANNSSLNENNSQRKRKLAQLQQNLNTDKIRYSSLEDQIKLLVKENYLFESKLKMRQKQLVLELSNIFTIEKSNEFMRILNSTLRLTNPYSNSFHGNNSIVILSMDDIKENSIAFGYIIQAIYLLSTFLCVPLRYPIVFRASRSFIIESFNDSDGNVREHALYDATQDESLNLAVSLLNKNVTQLRLLFDGYRNFDPNETLMNLKWIFDYFLFN